MQCIHIVGRQNHGKTTLMVELLEELTRRGLRPGTIKHTSHSHELDTPGKDSFRHRQSGAAPVAIVSKDLIGVYLPRDPEADFYESLAPMFDDCDVVLVEGHVDGPGTKIEVYRRSVGDVPLAAQRDDIIAVVSNDPVSTSVPIWPRTDIVGLVDRVLKHVSD
ncbi:MAG TPA: molybdopterin-guanine dinucleotide biosynthesis protein B [Thermoguttaceae bacterium]|nr:molybdopterin-guanine dinucleotide biosynthesis protein B [Thermoguttaceae bacterium]